MDWHVPAAYYESKLTKDNPGTCHAARAIFLWRWILRWIDTERLLIEANNFAHVHRIATEGVHDCTSLQSPPLSRICFERVSATFYLLTFPDIHYYKHHYLYLQQLFERFVSRHTTQRFFVHSTGAYTYYLVQHVNHFTLPCSTRMAYGVSYLHWIFCTRANVLGGNVLFTNLGTNPYD